MSTPFGHGTAGTALYWLLLLAMFAGIAKAMMGHTEEPRCLQCGGKGQHKDDCPWGDK